MAIKLSCTFTSYDWNDWGGRKTCDAYFEDITKFSPTVQVSERSDDFEAIKAVLIDYKKCLYIPRGLTKIFPNMKEFYVFHSKLTHLNRRDMKGYTQLETISFSQNRLAKIPYDTFEDLVNMKYFSLSINRLTEIPNLKAMKNLKELYLFSNFIQSFTSKDFSENKNLEVIWIYNNNLVSIDAGIFEYLPSLEVADFSTNDCVDAQFPETSKNDLMDHFKENCNETVINIRKVCLTH